MHKEIVIIALLVAVIICLCCKHHIEGMTTGYPRVRCPPGHTYDLDLGCVRTAPVSLIRPNGAVLRI